MAQVNEVVRGIYRISTFDSRYGITFNQFLIADDRPALIHTGPFQAYEAVRQAVGQVLDPQKLAYVVVPHFEADECGGMGRFVAQAPQAVLVCSEVGAGINLGGWDYAGPVRGVREGDVIELGSHSLRFLETPHVHHWDSLMAFEQSTRSLFPADLYLQPGEQPAVVRENLGEAMCQLYREAGIFAGEKPVLQALDRIERLEAQWVHPMHGGSLPGPVAKGYAQALRSRPFAFEGKLFGRALPQ